MTEDEKKEHRRAYWRERNRLPAKLAQHREWNRSHYAKDPRCAMLRNAKNRAKQSGVPFSISIDDIKMRSHCPVLGIPLFAGKGSTCPNSPTLDRVVGHLGYVPTNVIVVSHLANTIKNNADPEQIIRVGKFNKLLLENLPYVHTRKPTPKHRPSTAMKKRKAVP